MRNIRAKSMEGKKLYKRVLAMLLSLAMIIGMLPIGALAATPEVDEDVEIIAFEQLPEDIRWQNTTSPMFPETVSGTVEGGTMQIPVTWETEQDFDRDYPVKGLYVFRAEPMAGYVLANDTEPLVITVFIPETVSRFAMLRMGGAGTTDEPLEIATAAQLAEIATLVNARPNGLERFLFNNAYATVSLKLVNDIDLSAYGRDWNDGKGWAPIGNDYDSGAIFKGHFNGGRHIISGLYINRPEEDFQGLFGYVDGGTVENLGLVGVSIIGGDFVGGVGYISAGTVEHCYVTGSIVGTDYVGGIVGGINNSTRITNCYSVGSVSGSKNIGGIVGSINDFSITVSNCYSTTSVSGTDYVGGVAGRVIGKVINCAALGSSVAGGTGLFIGRVLGSLNSGHSGNIAFSGMTVNGSTVSDGAADNKNGAPKTAADLQAAGGFPESFADDPWTYEIGKLPGLGGKAIEMPAHIVDIPAGQDFLGAGTKEAPYQISTADQLAKLAELVNEEIETDKYNVSTVHYKMTADIDLSDYWEGGGWEPIGNTYAGESGWDYRPFYGQFNGDGHVITGLFIDSDQRLGSVGLFGLITNGKIENLGLIDVSVTSSITAIAGGMAGFIDGTTEIEQCFVTGIIEGGSYAGGLVGYILESDTSIKNSYTQAEVRATGTNSYAGGIVAGIIGGSTIENCYATGKITSTGIYGYAGGIAGFSEGGAQIKNCAALNTEIAGGTAARISGESYSGSLAKNMAFAGMLVNDETIKNGIASDENGANKTAEEINSATLWTTAGNGDTVAWDESIWDFTNGQLPILSTIGSQNSLMPIHLLSTGTIPFEGDGSESTPYQIKAAADLAALAQLVNGGNSCSGKYFQLENDLDLSAYGRNWNGGEGWMPIGNNATKFEGRFNGNDKAITGLYINRPNVENQGLFGVIDGLVISGSTDKVSVKNLSLKNVNIIGGVSVGALAGEIYSATVQGCSAEGSVTGSQDSDLFPCVGGLFGYTHSTKITSCHTAGVVQGNSNNIGGIIGYGLYGVQLSSSYSTAAVSGQNNIGGIAGFIAQGGDNYFFTVENCYSTGSITGEEYIGGLVGFAMNGTLQSCYSTSIISGSSENSYRIGGIVGELYESTLKNCAALNPAISGNWYIGRIAGNVYGESVTASNYGLKSMTVNVSSDKGNSAVDGADLTSGQANSAVFWTTADNWDGIAWDISTWNIEDGKLPILKGFSDGDQSGDGGLYLTSRDIQYAVVGSITETFTYNGSLQISDLTITFDGHTLVKDMDYSVAVAGDSASDGNNAGTVKLTLTGIGNFSGTKNATYTIKKADQEIPPSAISGISSKTSTSITINEITGDEEYGINTADIASTDWQDETTFANLTPNTEYYIFARFKDDGNRNPSPASSSILVTTDKAKLAGSVTIEGTAKFGEPLTVNTGGLTTDVSGYNELGTPSYQWYRSSEPVGGEQISGANQSTYTLTQEDIDFYINVEVTSSNCEGSIWGEGTKTEKADSPAAPTVTGSYTGDGTHFTYIIAPINGAEYSMPYGDWQDSNVFSGFTTASPAINFYARIKETQTHEAGQIGSTGDVEFTRLDDRSAPELDYTISETDFPKTVTITEVVGGEYSFDGTSWSDINTYISDGEEDLTLYIRLKENATHIASSNSSIEINTKDKNQEAPATFTLIYQNINNQSYTVTIPSTAGAEYSFDGENWSSDNTKAGLKPKDSVTGYKRMATRPGYNPSPAVSDALTLPEYSSGDDSGGTSILPTIPVADGSIEIEYNVSSGTASLSIDTTKTEEIIEKAKDNEAVLDLQSEKNATAVEMPRNALSSFAKADLDLVVKLPAGNVNIDNRALASILEQSTETADLKLELKEIATDNLTAAQKETVKDEDLVFDINISVGTKNITEFNGELIINVPYDGELPVAVWYLNDRGELEKIEASYNNGAVSFVLNHLSLYLVGKDITEVKGINPLTDVKEDSWYYGSVKYVYENDLMKGTGTDTFSPDGITTRGMIVTILHRLEGKPIAGTNTFTDVAKDKYYTPAVAWASGNNIVTGYGNGKFGPEEAITREQMAAILMKYAKFKGHNISTRADLSKYADLKDISSWATEAMSWVNAEGLIQGDGNKLMPTGNATRAQVAAILKRFVERIAK